MDKHILVVDDQPGIRLLLSEILEQLGYYVSQAGSGQEALALCQQQNFDLVLLDLKMPGISGLETLRCLRALGGNLPVVLISATQEPELLEEAQALGISGRVEKPFDLTSVQHMAIRLLNP